MKKALLFILFMLFSVEIQAQQNPQVLFNKANKLLQEGKIVQALDHYKKLIEEEKTSGALFVNTAYTFMRLGKLGKAKYYFLKARQFPETREKAIAGLEVIESKLSHQPTVLPALPWERALNWLQAALGPAFILGIGLILINLGVFILVLSWLAKKSSSPVTKIATGVAIAGVVAVMLSFYIDYRRQRYSKAVMVTAKANVVQKPSTQATLINKAYEGYSFTVDHKKSKNYANWVFVEMSNGSRGWIRRKEIMIL